MNQLINFNGTTVSIIDHAGRKWLTAKEVGLCLGYSEDSAGTGITNLYNRHLDRFDATDTCTIKLMAQGQAREVRIFSTTGCVTLGWLSNTKRAGEFQKWAKQALAEQLNGEKVALDFNEVNTIVDCAKPGELGREARQLATEIFSRFGHPAPIPATPAPKKKNGRTSITRAIERQVFELFVEGYSQKQIAQAVDISATSVNQLLQAKYRFTPGAGEPECDYALLADVAARQYDIEMERIESMRVRIAQKFMPNANNKELEEVLEQIGQNLNCELLTGYEE